MENKTQKCHLENLSLPKTITENIGPKKVEMITIGKTVYRALGKKEY